jgi:tRNA(Ile2)-agmatinylcytidine synthase
VRLHIGIDDTDSKKGGCTTYIAARLVEQFSQIGAKFRDYPNIIRLNPNIPYKTRGNAAVAFRLSINQATYDTVQETVLRCVEQNSRLGDLGTDPAVVFLKGNPNTKIQAVARKALSDIVSLKEAIRALHGAELRAVCYGTGLGLVGALAAVGQNMSGDHTYELIAYRERWNCGTTRHIDPESVKRMDQLTTPYTFNNYDSANRRILIAPHGPDPVLLGIRGESALDVLNAFHLLRLREPVERWVIFRTNHATDAHFEYADDDIVRFDRPVKLAGIVLDKPQRIAGGHVIFTLKHRSGAVKCAAFEPTGRFKEVAAKLVPGDKVTVFGGVRKRSNLPPTINLEKLIVRYLAPETALQNPICPQCGKHMKSAGRFQGFRCVRCHLNSPHAAKCEVIRSRSVLTGLYLPDKKAHRHLTKPISRYGIENRKWDGAPPSGEWHSP